MSACLWTFSCWHDNSAHLSDPPKRCLGLANGSCREKTRIEWHHHWRHSFPILAKAFLYRIKYKEWLTKGSWKHVDNREDGYVGYRICRIQMHGGDRTKGTKSDMRDTTVALFSCWFESFNRAWKSDITARLFHKKLIYCSFRMSCPKVLIYPTRIHPMSSIWTTKFTILKCKIF